MGLSGPLIDRRLAPPLLWAVRLRHRRRGRLLLLLDLAQRLQPLAHLLDRFIMVLLRAILSRVAPRTLVLRSPLSPRIPVPGSHALDRVRVDALLVRDDLWLLALRFSATRALPLAFPGRLTGAHLPVHAILL